MSAMFDVISEPNKKYDWITIRIKHFLCLWYILSNQNTRTLFNLPYFAKTCL